MKMYKKVILWLLCAINIAGLIMVFFYEKNTSAFLLEKKNINDMEIRFSEDADSREFVSFVVNRKHNAILLQFILSRGMREIGGNDFTRKYEKNIGCILIGELLGAEEFRNAFPSLRYNLKLKKHDKLSYHSCFDRYLLQALVEHRIWDDKEIYVKLRTMYGSEIADLAYKYLFLKEIEERNAAVSFPDAVYRDAVCAAAEYVRRVAEYESENEAEKLVQTIYSYVLGTSFIMWGYNNKLPFHSVINERMLDYAKGINDAMLGEAMIFASDGQVIILPPDKKDDMPRTIREIIKIWRRRIEKSMTLQDYMLED